MLRSRLEDRIGEGAEEEFKYRLLSQQTHRESEREEILRMSVTLPPTARM
jgi:hypothetical protein